MSVPYQAQRPVDDFGQPFSDLKYTVALPNAADTIFTVPGDSPRYKMIVSVGAGDVDVWMALNAVAVVPPNSFFDKSNSELVYRLCREVVPGDEVHFIKDGAAIFVSIVLYSLFN